MKELSSSSTTFNAVGYTIILLTIFLNSLEGVGSIAPKTNSINEEISRRTFFTQQLVTVVGASVLFNLNNEKVLALENKGDDVAFASSITKPYAPMEALLPASRLKIWTDEAYKISSSLSSFDSIDQKFQKIKELNVLLSTPPKLFITEKISKRTIGSTAQVTSAISKANKDEYQMNRRGFNVGDKFTAMLNQADVERQWGMLQYAESKREESNEMRAALNFYTQQLSFGDKFQLTASKEERKKMIRNDEIPSLSAVITSDLDLRDLYRNEFLTAIEDAQAEVAYQAKQIPDTIDISDIEELMKQAYVALSKWFDLISNEDVVEALSCVGVEE